MNLYKKLRARAEEGNPVRVGMIGAGKFGSMFLAQAARIVSNPPERALWGVPDNVSGMKLYKLVQQLKHYGLPERKAHVSISRMSAGGGDQYGSYNTPAPESGIIKGGEPSFSFTLLVRSLPKASLCVMPKP